MQGRPSQEPSLCAVQVLKPRLKSSSLDKRALKELLVRLMYVEMLGHDASWGHVTALQACSDKALLTKKVPNPLTTTYSSRDGSCSLDSEPDMLPMADAALANQPPLSVSLPQHLSSAAADQ